MKDPPPESGGGGHDAVGKDGGEIAATVIAVLSLIACAVALVSCSVSSCQRWIRTRPELEDFHHRGRF